MVKLNIVKPPRINLGDKKMGFWKQIGMIVLGTTISLILTLLTAKITDSIQRANDHRLSAMMVMSNIEKFARNLEEIANYMVSNDSTAAWLLSKEVEELEFMPANWGMKTRTPFPTSAITTKAPSAPTA